MAEPENSTPADDVGPRSVRPAPHRAYGAGSEADGEPVGEAMMDADADADMGRQKSLFCPPAPQGRRSLFRR